MVTVSSNGNKIIKGCCNLILNVGKFGANIPCEGSFDNVNMERVVEKFRAKSQISGKRLRRVSDSCCKGKMGEDTSRVASEGERLSSGARRISSIRRSPETTTSQDVKVGILKGDPRN